MTLPILALIAAAVTAWACYELGKRRERERWERRVREQVARMTRPAVPSFFDGTACAEPDEYPPLGVVDRHAGFTVFNRGRG